MKRKILVLLVPLSLLIPVSGVFAQYENEHGWDYKDGILDDSSLIKEINMFPEHWDNDLETSARTFNADYIEFNYPMNLQGIFLKTTSQYNFSELLIDYMDDNFRRETVTYYTTDQGYQEIDFQNVIRIRFDNRYPKNLHQIEFFGEISDDVSIPIGDIMHLDIDYGFDFINLSWQNPTHEELDHIEIHVNDEVFTTESENFNIENLSPNTKYEITIVTVEKNGNKSEGKWLEVTTEPLPENITNLEYEKDHNSIDFTYDLPDSEHFSHLIIEKDGLEISNDYTSSTFLTIGLEPETTYIFKFISVYNDGTKSDGIIQSVTTNEYIEEIPLIPPNDPVISEYNGSITISFDKPTGNIIGYNIYINGELYNSEPLTNTNHIITGLENDKTYDIQLSSVDLDGNESELSEVYQGTPDETSLPIFRPSYSLQDVSISVSNWFAGLWQLLAFAVSIPLSFIISGRIRNLFV